MSWTDIDLTGVSTDLAMIPEGEYVFALLPGSKYNQFDTQKIEVGAKVVEGEYAGRVQYFSYGDPAKSPAMEGAFKRLKVALFKNTGVEIDKGEDPIVYLNNPEVVGAKFVANVTHRTFTNKEGESQTKSDIAVFKTRAIPKAV